MNRATRLLVGLLMLLLALALFWLAPPPPPADADPGCFDSGSADCGGHTWNGPLRQTWNTPGYYGGWTGGNEILCSPFTYDCQGITSDG